jgi:NADPH:quinone reductase-like Zn-dependent oxidoreductase
MIAYRIVSDQGIDAIERARIDTPRPGPGEVSIDLRAASLNFRDLVVAKGGYPGNDRRPSVAMSDGAGVVAEVGPGVTAWKPGDRVVANFMRDWAAGAVTEPALNSSLGGGVDGVLAERFLTRADSVVPIPHHLDFAEAATLPCAALTAWNALTAANTTAGDTVLMLGTGGVSVFALQLAKAMGAVPIVTSSSDAKLERARALGAVHTINYTTHPDWHEQVLKITDGRGVDHVMETAGPGTLERSLQSAAIGGTVSLIGIMADGTPPAMTIALLRALTVRGIYVGSTEMFSAMNRAIEAAGLRPVIDRRFAFDDALNAYRSFEKQTHFGKVVIVREAT